MQRSKSIIFGMRVAGVPLLIGIRQASVLALLIAGALSLQTSARGEETHDSKIPDTIEVLPILVEEEWIKEDRQFALHDARESGTGVIDVPVNERGVRSFEDAAGGCDGIKNGKCGFHTASNELDPWWQVDLGAVHHLDRIVVYNRTDGNAAARTRQLRILVAAEQVSGSQVRKSECWDFTEIYQHDGTTFLGVQENAPLTVMLQGRDIHARVIRLQVPGQCSFALDEVEVYGSEDSADNLALGKPADQKSVGPYSYPGTKGEKYTPPAPVLSEDNLFSVAHSRNILERTAQLAYRIQGISDRQGNTEVPGLIKPLLARRDGLVNELARLETLDQAPLEARRRCYLACRQLLREIAFLNPMLDIDRLLFVKRHDPGGLFHMCHQYYGFSAKAGGGLYILTDPFSSTPGVQNLLQGSLVEAGRMKGLELAPGSFVSPDVSYDGNSILFAYTEAKGAYPEWSPQSSFHIFKVNADGSGLAQLTDGDWNDFDPCFLPNGRIVFISERRGGYLRCGGSSPPLDSPTYTLHSMQGDGSDIICLSYHDTHEWHPSVNNAGMLVYTRWDYVDRGTNVAHHIWNCYPDGRDPRAFHGNYPTVRESRPWMEMSIRAIPGSQRYVATAAAHHGHAFGSLVLIDPHIEDDGAMSQITRLTPDVPFPEAEVHIRPIRDCMAYGTPWPLGEDDYLCVYDKDCKNRGIYWIDRFGNRELIYRDPAISCLSPMPLQPRFTPPVIPTRTTQATGEKPQPASIAVMNVYTSDFEWPANTKIAALRVIQVLPKSTAPSNKPRIGIASQTNARAVLGTVPVEADGSAYFEAPVGKLIYFQALDEQGLAVQSMRSGTYVHPGEQLMCVGCHESKHETPEMKTDGTNLPAALRRAPSPIQPDVEGSNPFSFVRLVQPALDRNCVACHKSKNAIDLSGDIEGDFGWTRSYTRLAKSYGFFYESNNGSIRSERHGGSRTVAGQFGARASTLLPYLSEAHCETHLPEDDFHRITLWLDCNSEFYGAYENTIAQARGEIVWPSLD